jgi:hypothetical protein
MPVLSWPGKVIPRPGPKQVRSKAPAAPAKATTSARRPQAGALSMDALR